MARDISGLVAGMQLLEPGFAVAPHGATTIGRVRTSGDPVIEATIDEALHTADFTVVDIDWEVLAPGNDLFTAIYFAEMFECDHELAESDPSGIGEDVAGMLAMAPAFAEGAAAARVGLQRWRESVFALFDQVELLALPTLPIFPPRLDSLNPDSLLPTVIDLTRHVSLFNAAGTPCTAQPVRTTGGPLPASLQLVGPLNGEALLLATAHAVESAMA
jgi:amidase